ncbi:MAG: radical SAM protein [Bacteroidota bacterium]
MNISKNTGYQELHRKGILRERADRLLASMSSCNLCPRNCLVDRLNEEKGICKTGRQAVVSSYSPHFGEEKPLVGTYGSGTIFFTNCNLLCMFCQNYEISHLGRGTEVSDEQLAGIMMDLQYHKCHNINLVSPSHVVPQVLSAIDIAAGKGLEIPVVFNTGSYDKVETIRELEGVVDIYMPDFKFWSHSLALKTCSVTDYRQVAVNAIGEMYRQAGDLEISEEGLARRGLLLRHLVMPGYTDDSKRILEHIKKEVSENTYINIMAQYHPCGQSYGDASLGRALELKEYREVLDFAIKLGFQRIDY